MTDLKKRLRFMDAVSFPTAVMEQPSKGFGNDVAEEHTAEFQKNLRDEKRRLKAEIKKAIANESLSFEAFDNQFSSKVDELSRKLKASGLYDQEEDLNRILFEGRSDKRN